MDYTLTDTKLRTLKSAVTRAQRKRDWRKVIAACELAERTFKEQGYPDCWADFERHKGDAEVQLKLFSFTGPIFS
jgi:hypothetical protein